MAEKRFSLKTLLVLITCIALALSCFQLVQSNWRLQRDVNQARDKQAQAEKQLDQWKSKDESEFWGANGEPLFLYHFRDFPNNTSLDRIKNSKYSPVKRTSRIGLDPVLATFSYELRLLRSLDGTDYYLLSYSTGGKPYRSIIEYTGATKVIENSPELVLVMAKTKEAVFDALYEKSTNAELREKIENWKRGDGRAPATEMVPHSPAAGRQ